MSMPPLNPLDPPAIGTPLYWQVLGQTAAGFIDSQRGDGDHITCLNTYQAVMSYWGKRGLTDLVVLLVLYAATQAQPDYRHEDGRPDGDTLCPERADALTTLAVADYAETVIGPSGEGAAQDLARSEQAINSIDSTRTLLQAALEAAHTSTAPNARINVQKVLAPARRDMGVLASMLALGTGACRTVINHEENPV